MIKELNKETLKEALTSGKLFVIDFYADWCGPCKMLSPIIHEIAEEYPEYKVCKVDVDEDSALAVRYNIISIPTLIVVKNGKATHTSVGFRQKEEILKLLED